MSYPLRTNNEQLQNNMLRENSKQSGLDDLGNQCKDSARELSDSGRLCPLILAFPYNLG